MTAITSYLVSENIVEADWPHINLLQVTAFIDDHKKLNDGWGQPLKLSYNEVNKTFILRSLGSDGVISEDDIVVEERF